MKILFSIIIFLILGSLFVIAYVLNNKTPKPEGCSNFSSNCEGCSITTCIHNNGLKGEIKND